jgi:hypothetical protein
MSTLKKMWKSEITSKAQIMTALNIKMLGKYYKVVNMSFETQMEKQNYPFQK